MNLEQLEHMGPWEWPEDTDEKVFLDLTDGKRDDEERIQRAARIAGKYVIINDDLAEVLLSILQDSTESLELRGTAAPTTLEFASHQRPDSKRALGQEKSPVHHHENLCGCVLASHPGFRKAAGQQAFCPDLQS